MLNLNNTEYLVVGGSSGIGLALAKMLQSREAKVRVLSRSANEALTSAGISHSALDITQASIDDIRSQLPERLQGLAYCPGSITLKPFQRLTEVDLRTDWEINLLGAFKVVQAALPALKKGSPAGIVLFSTVAVHAGMNFHASIASAKAAVEGFAKSLAAEFAASDIRVNVIAPSITETPLAASLLNSEARKTAAENRHPLKRIGQPADIAGIAAQLITPESRWITGQVIAVDGGLSALRPL